MLHCTRELKLPEEETKRLEMACRLHDVGKIAIPDSILGKPGELTENEWEVVKRHPVRGADILSAAGFLKDVVPLVRHHHESWDGTGYPDGIKGEEIPLGARIIRIADAFEVMTSDRPHRKALEVKRALEEIRLGAGSKFDPKLTDPFITLFKRQKLQR